MQTIRYWPTGLALRGCILLVATAPGALADTPETHKHTNHLIDAASPYLLQHAHNPVNWYPWGDEAFDKAVKEDKPIFLSIGYAACHWCHVMERESFENEAIAAVLNEHFVAIKVDREERPDVDEIYMSATVAMSGRGCSPICAIMILMYDAASGESISTSRSRAVRHASFSFSWRPAITIEIAVTFP